MEDTQARLQEVAPSHDRRASMASSGRGTRFLNRGKDGGPVQGHHVPTNQISKGSAACGCAKKAAQHLLLVPSSSPASASPTGAEGTCLSAASWQLARDILSLVSRAACRTNLPTYVRQKVQQELRQLFQTAASTFRHSSRLGVRLQLRAGLSWRWRRQLHNHLRWMALFSATHQAGWLHSPQRRPSSWMVSPSATAPTKLPETAHPTQPGPASGAQRRSP